MALSYTSVTSGGSSGPVSNDFTLNIGSSGFKKTILGETFPEGTYLVVSSLGDSTYDIYFIATDGTFAGSVSAAAASSTITATKSFNKVVVYGGSNNDSLSFSFKNIYSPTENSTTDVSVGPTITANSNSSMANVNDTTSITGTNFAEDVVVNFMGTDGVSRLAKSVTRTSSVLLSVTRPDTMPGIYSPFKLIVSNPGISSSTSTNSHILNNAVNGLRPPTSLSLSKPALGQLQVSFTAASGASSYVAYTTTGGFSQSGASSPITISGLEDGTSYGVYVVSISGADTSANSSTSTATTLYPLGTRWFTSGPSQMSGLEASSSYISYGANVGVANPNGAGNINVRRIFSSSDGSYFSVASEIDYPSNTSNQGIGPLVSSPNRMIAFLSSSNALSSGYYTDNGWSTKTSLPATPTTGIYYSSGVYFNNAYYVLPTGTWNGSGFSSVSTYGYSTNGTSWSNPSLPASSIWSWYGSKNLKAQSAPNVIVGTPSSSTSTGYYYNGSSWTSFSWANSSGVQSLSYSAGQGYAYWDGTNIKNSATLGGTWTNKTNPITAGWNFSGLTFAGKYWIISGNNPSSPYTGKIWKSTDLTTWTEVQYWTDNFATGNTYGGYLQMQDMFTGISNVTGGKYLSANGAYSSQVYYSNES
jgi:hypothetical protein